jgi:hypothetical protein
VSKRLKSITGHKQRSLSLRPCENKDVKQVGQGQGVEEQDRVSGQHGKATGLGGGSLICVSVKIW